MDSNIGDGKWSIFPFHFFLGRNSEITRTCSQLRHFRLNQLQNSQKNLKPIFSSGDQSH